MKRSPTIKTLDEFVFITIANNSNPSATLLKIPIHGWYKGGLFVLVWAHPTKENPAGINQQGKPRARDTFVQVLLVWRLGPYLF
jgi:hypothetical protein